MHYLSKMAYVRHRNKSVAELKAFLRERGVNTSVYRKDSLIRLAEAASDIKLEPEEVDDYQSDRQNPGTIESTDGTDIILPDILSFSDWEKDMSRLPHVEMGDVFAYLMTTCMRSGERLKAYKSDNGYQLFMQRHIDNVVVKLLQCDHVYVRCWCTPETRQKEKPYLTWILMDTKGSVKSGGCTCVADDGSCKHCVGLLFALQDFTDRHKDRGTEVCTDKPCKWDRPRQISNPVTIQNLNYGKKDTRDTYKPVTQSIKKDDVIKSLFKVCKDHGSVFIHTVDPPSDESDVESDLNNNMFPCMPEIMQKYKFEHSTEDQRKCLAYIRNIHTVKMVNDIELATRDQSDNQMWFDLRKGRITASVMGSILNCNLDRLSENNYIVRKINGDIPFFSTQATEYGRKMETVAISQYTENYAKTHNKVNVTSAGLSISGKCPYIAASPDGHVKCVCCGQGLIEIKCTFAHQHEYTKDIASAGNYHVGIVNNEVKLNESSSWYAQIQTQLFSTEKSWCDFVLFTQKGYCH